MNCIGCMIKQCCFQCQYIFCLHSVQILKSNDEPDQAPSIPDTQTELQNNQIRLSLHRVWSDLKCVCNSVQEFDDKQWRDLGLDDREEEELAPVNGDEIMVWCLQDRRNILQVQRFLLRLQKVVTHTPADDTLPVFLQEDVPRVINKEQTVDHLSCNNEVVVALGVLCLMEEQTVKSRPNHYMTVFYDKNSIACTNRQLQVNATSTLTLVPISVNLSELTSTQVTSGFQLRSLVSSAMSCIKGNKLNVRGTTATWGKNRPKGEKVLKFYLLITVVLCQEWFLMPIWQKWPSCFVSACCWFAHVNTLYHECLSTNCTDPIPTILALF